MHGCQGKRLNKALDDLGSGPIVSTTALVLGITYGGKPNTSSTASHRSCQTTHRLWDIFSQAATTCAPRFTITRYVRLGAKQKYGIRAII